MFCLCLYLEDKSELLAPGMDLENKPRNMIAVFGKQIYFVKYQIAFPLVGSNFIDTILAAHFPLVRGLNAMASAASQNTPKKYYPKASKLSGISRCRLCNSVTDPVHAKNLYRDSNKTILRNAEQIYGSALPSESGLPHLVCRPCERRVNNAIQLRNVIAETQQLLKKDVREKRCVEISPRVDKPPAKVHAAGPRRRSLDFSASAYEQPNVSVQFIIHIWIVGFIRVFL